MAAADVAFLTEPTPTTLSPPKPPRRSPSPSLFTPTQSSLSHTVTRDKSPKRLPERGPVRPMLPERDRLLASQRHNATAQVLERQRYDPILNTYLNEASERAAVDATARHDRAMEARRVASMERERSYKEEVTFKPRPGAGVTNRSVNILALPEEPLDPHIPMKKRVSAEAAETHFNISDEAPSIRSSKRATVDIPNPITQDARYEVRVRPAKKQLSQSISPPRERRQGLRLVPQVATSPFAGDRQEVLPPPVFKASYVAAPKSLMTSTQEVEFKPTHKIRHLPTANSGGYDIIKNDVPPPQDSDYSVSAHLRVNPRAWTSSTSPTNIGSSEPAVTSRPSKKVTQYSSTHRAEGGLGKTSDLVVKSHIHTDKNASSISFEPPPRQRNSPAPVSMRNSSQITDLLQPGY